MRFLVSMLVSLACVAAASTEARAADPIGYLDDAGCNAVAGWSQDPDVPGSPIAVHLYFGGPASSGAPAVATLANVYRDDLCTAIGSCEHGFIAGSPLSLHDGGAHDVYAYGINDGAGTNPQLGVVHTLACAPDAQTGIRRRIDGVPTLNAWRFDGFWDLLPLGEGAASLAQGPDLPERPRLVRGDDDAPEVWLIDGDGHLRRHVTPETAATWRLDLSAIEIVDATKLALVTEGTELRARPVTFIDGALFVVDEPQPDASNGPSLDPPPPSVGDGGGGVGGGDDGAGGGGDNGFDDASNGGCAMQPASDASSGAAASVVLALFGLVAARRLRDARRAST